MNEATVVQAAGVPRILVLQFRGRAAEFFRIWIVNLVLSVLTLGIYSAWAKVRTRRYFHGNTRLDDAAFEYHARPMAILKGRLLALAVIGGLSLLNAFSPAAGAVGGLFYLFALPWVIKTSLRFNARMTSYRNVRFDFVGGYWHAFLVFLVLPPIAILPFGLLLPVWHRAMAHYLMRNYRFGGRAIAAELPLGPFYVIYLQALGLFVLLFAVIGAVAAMLALPRLSDLEAAGGAAIKAAIALAIWVPVAGLYLLLVPFVRAKVRNLAFGLAKLEGGHRFASGVSPWVMAWIALSNVVVVVLTLGLMLPWAKVRTARYLVEHTAVTPNGEIAGFVSGLPAGQQAFGAEFADMLGFDIGF